MGAVGGPLVPMAVAVRIDAALQALFAGGGGLRAPVRRDEGGLFVLLGDRRVPLPMDAGIPAGREVLIRYERADQGPRLTIQLIERPVTDAPSASNTLARVIADVLPPADPARFASLIPRALPISEAVVRGILELLTVRAPATADRAVLAELVTTAAAKGALDPEKADRLRALLAGDSGNVTAERVAVAAQRARTTLEARLGAMIAARGTAPPGDPIAGDLRAELLALKNDASFAQFVKSVGSADEIERAADGLILRLTAEHVQNAHQPGGTYAFFELPRADGSVAPPQIHVFEDAGGAAEGRERTWTLVIDVELSKLGPLWITLTMRGEACSCSFRAANAQVVEALRGSASEISEALIEIGFGRVEVSAEAGPEDRVERLLALSKRYSGVDVSA